MPARFQRIAEHGLGVRGFRPHIDHPRRSGRVFRPRGNKPQRMSDNSQTGSLGFWRMTATGWVGAMLKRGLQLSSADAVSRYSNDLCNQGQSRDGPSRYNCPSAFSRIKAKLMCFPMSRSRCVSGT
jgi:hypothetical protein